MTREDFIFLTSKIHQLSGLRLTEKKIELVKSRVQSYFRKSRIKSLTELKNELEKENPAVIQDFINLMTTNKTDFFREPKHFDFLIREAVPGWKAAGIDDVKVWCCASSTGEEPYSLAMTLASSLASDISWDILATDIDTEVLKRAKNGVYPISKAAEIPESFQQYLIPGQRQATGWFKIADELHSKVRFSRRNLIENPNPEGQVFDAIFCRNVLIYFDRTSINHLMEQLHRSLKPNGFLFIGHSESIQGNQHLFETVSPSVFRKID